MTKAARRQDSLVSALICLKNPAAQNPYKQPGDS
jgi:hypothetical protein